MKFDIPFQHSEKFYTPLLSYLAWIYYKNLYTKKHKLDIRSGTETKNRKDVSNAMNNFFCTIGRELADEIQPASNPLLSGEYEVNKDKAKFHFTAIELKDIRDAFAKVKTAKSFGTDNISSYFMKLALPYIEKSLAFLFNTSIETSQFPDSWKVARITPIFKEIRLKNLIIAQCQSCLSSQSSLKNLFSTSCTCI